MGKFRNGDPVRFDWETEQIEKESEFKIPFTVSKTEKKDLYSSGLPMDCWENIVTVVDANDEVVAETEEDELILLDSPQTVVTEIEILQDKDVLQEFEEVEELSNEELHNRHQERYNFTLGDLDYEKRDDGIQC